MIIGTWEEWKQCKVRGGKENGNLVSLIFVSTGPEHWDELGKALVGIKETGSKELSQTETSKTRECWQINLQVLQCKYSYEDYLIGDTSNCEIRKHTPERKWKAGNYKEITKTHRF